MAGRPLRPATDRCFGEPLPHQPANQSSAAPLARGPCGSPSFFRRTHAVLANLSAGCPPRADTFRCITHPFATRRRREASFSPRYRSTCMCKAFRQRSILARIKLYCLILCCRSNYSCLVFDGVFSTPSFPIRSSNLKFAGSLQTS